MREATDFQDSPTKKYERTHGNSKGALLYLPEEVFGSCVLRRPAGIETCPAPASLQSEKRAAPSFAAERLSLAHKAAELDVYASSPAALF